LWEKWTSEYIKGKSRQNSNPSRLRLLKAVREKDHSDGNYIAKISPVQHRETENSNIHMKHKEK
jgi:hypothetical protein